MSAPKRRMDPEDEATSDYASSIAASEFTTAKTCHIRYLVERGRRYQALFGDDRYGLPNDEPEQMREGIKHHLYCDYLLENKLIISPIDNNPQKIVDLGTGVGFWAHDAAERYPSARIIGTDLSPIQSKWVSPNCEFRIEDLEDEQRPWTSIYGGADLIHIRGLVATLRRPQRLIDRTFENIRPGGWIELHEIIPEVQSDDGTATMSHPLNQLYTLLRGSYSQRFGWDLDTPRRIEQMLESAGFVNVQTRHNHVPLGRWGKDQRSREMGMFCQSVCEDLVAALSTRHAALGISEEEAGRMSGEFLRAANDLSVHGWLDWVDVWAQKPGGA